MKNLITLIIVITTFNSSAQTLHLSISDVNENPTDCRVFKNDSLIENNYFFTFSIKKGDKITLKHDWYRDTVIRITETLTPNDTLFKFVQLKQKVKQIGEVVVSGAKYQLIYEKNNEFVTDYYPIPNNKLLLLSRIGKNRYLKVLDEQSNPQKELTLQINATELFLDAMGIFYVLTVDSAYQLAFSDTDFHLMKGISNELFQKTIPNLVAIDNNNAFYKNYSRHSQLFTIEILSQQNGRKEIYNSFDKIGFQGAQDSYNDMVYYYLANIPEWRNIILLGLWSGDAYELVDPLDAKLNPMYTWYKKVMALPLKVSAFGMLDQLVILDNVENKILQMDYSTCQIVHSVTPEFELSRHYYFDYFHDALYTFTEKKGITEVFQIDINTGEAISIAQLTDVLLPRNIKVSNKWVYFTLLDEDGYNKVLKAKR